MTEYDKVIPPGSEGKIFASVDVSHASGEISKAIDFTTNDPSMPEGKVMINAVVKSYVTMEPAEFIRFQGKKGMGATQELTLTAQGGATITGATSTSSAFSVKLDPAGNNDKYRLKVNLNNNVEIGTTRGEVRVAIQGPINEISIPVVAIIEGPLSIDPRSVAFVIRDYPEEITTTVTVDMKQGPDLTAVTVQKVDAGTKFRVIRQDGNWFQVILAETETEVKNSAGKTSKVPERKIGWLQKSATKISKNAAAPEPVTISIQDSAGRAFKVLNYQSTDPDIKVELKPAQASKSFEMTVSMLRIPKKKGNQRSSIVLTTDNADQPEIKIPVFITIT